jgi:hypothetical protein
LGQVGQEGLSCIHFSTWFVYYLLHECVCTFAKNAFVIIQIPYVVLLSVINT